MIRVCFWGVRGSIPTPGKDTMKVGGNTACVEISCENNLIILDGGTGLRVLGDTLMQAGTVRASMFFSHMHWDHIQGFPFFRPALTPKNHFDLYGGKNLNTTLAETLSGQMNFPNFPLTLEQMAADMAFHEFHDGQVVKIGAGITVTALSLSHPGGCYGYRVACGDRTITYCSDTEHKEGGPGDPNVLTLAKDADLFIYDAQYTPEEYNGEVGPSKIGWGHSTFAKGAELAACANAKRLVLFHHDPTHSDAQIRKIERRCQKQFHRTEAAREGRVIEL